MYFAVITQIFLCCSEASAQRPAPIAATTITTTSTSADSLHVGCVVGSASCSGGIKAGVIAVASVTVGTGGTGIVIASQVPSSTTNALYNNSGNLYFNGVALATGASVSGTANQIAKFTGASSIGNSIVTDDGATVTVAGVLASNAFSATQVTVNGVGIINSSGKIPAISSTYFTSLSGANLTSIPTSAVSTGNYVATMSGGTNITVSGSGSNAATPSVALVTSPAIAGTLSIAGSGATTTLLHVAGTYTISASFASSDVSPALTATANGNAYVFQLAGSMASAASGTHSRLSYMDVSPAFTNSGAAVTTWSTVDIGTVTLAGAVVAGYGLKVAAPVSATANYAAAFTGGNVGIGTATPAVLAHLYVAGTTPGITTSSTQLVIQNNSATSDSTGLTFISGASTGTANIRFGTSGNQATDTLIYDYATGSLSFSSMFGADTRLTSSTIAMTSSQNNKALGLAQYVVLDSTGAGGPTTLTGATKTTGSGVAWFLLSGNDAGPGVSISNEDASSTAANRFHTASGGSYDVSNSNDLILVVYNAVLSRWLATRLSGS